MGGRRPPRVPRPLIEARHSTAVLVLGDTAVILLVIAVGLTTHDIAPLTNVWYTIRTALPFLIGWALAAPVLGAYGRRARDSIPLVVLIVFVVWGVAVLIGGAIRATDLVPGGSPPIFVAVTFASGLLGLVPWRVAAIVLSRWQRNDRTTHPGG